MKITKIAPLFESGFKVRKNDILSSVHTLTNSRYTQNISQGKLYGMSRRHVDMELRKITKSQMVSQVNDENH